MSLAVDQFASLDASADSGCFQFPAAPAATEYLVVPQLATGTPGQMFSFHLGGDTIRVATASPTAVPAAVSNVDRFHAFLRTGDERRFWGFAPQVAPAAAPAERAPTRPTSGPPAMNSVGTFQVCAKLDCSSFTRVGAKVRAVKSKVAIYVDTLAPAGGLDSVGIDSIAKVFDQRLYAVDTAAFGRESDIDNNSVVLVLMTNVVNKLITPAECDKSGFVAGFFFGADLDPAFRNDPRSNKGELFYSVVADPQATLSCSHTVSELQAFLPVTFVHEFQHMISFNQHVLLKGGSGEVLWLNEGFSHYAEELGGRSYESTPDARVSDCTIGTANCRFYVGNLLNAYMYLDSTENHFLLPTGGIGTLGERGAAWLFVRYVVDRYSAGATMADWNALTRSLVQTASTGAQNIAAVTGQPFDVVVSHWAVANWLTDDFGAAPEFRYDSWGFHSVFASLNSQRPTLFPHVFPLIPTVSAGRDLAFSGTLRAGSGVYFRATQQAGDPGFTLHLTAPDGTVLPTLYAPRLNVIRLQ